MGNSSSNFKHFINSSHSSNILDPLDSPNDPEKHKQPPKSMLLKIFVADQQLDAKYSEHIQDHNLAMKKSFFDSGFDIFNPSLLTLGEEDSTTKYDMGIQCAAFDSVSGDPMPFYVYPRSSIYKTPLRMANSVGVIDSGYRGNICVVLDKLPQPPSYTINPGARNFQICAPDLRRIHVTLVDSANDLGSTERGEGGFGSTGGNI